MDVFQHLGKYASEIIESRPGILVFINIVAFATSILLGVAAYIVNDLTEEIKTVETRSGRDYKNAVKRIDRIESLLLEKSLKEHTIKQTEKTEQDDDDTE